MQQVAIYWALQLTKGEGWNKIIIESDSKVCIDGLLSVKMVCDWCISVLYVNIKLLAADFNMCCFCWVRREANMAVHTFAKLVPSPRLHVLYFSKNLSSSLEEA